MGVDLSAKLLQPSRLRKRRQQVAAVCYRIRRRGIEFLLVQTRGGRWIFPKGGVESGLTHAQSAALEAFEEAGVHGRMEEIPFARYFRRRLDTATTKKETRPVAARSSEPELGVAAHLCEVSRLEPPQESNRNPTWFSAEKAKQRLREDRAPAFGAELVRVVDRALSRIQGLRSGASKTPDRRYRDELQKVRFEFFEDGRLHDGLREAALARRFLRQRDAHSAAIEFAVQAHLRKVLQIGASEEIRRPVLRLGAVVGSPAETARNITAIDSGRRANPSKPGSLASSKHKVPGKLAGGRAQKS
jgi:8-oxo-dGTP pyrophosphatase MutT (NUDIX family)